MSENEEVRNIGDHIIYGNKKLSDLFKEVHKNSTKKNDVIYKMVQDLDDLSTTLDEKLNCITYIRQLLETSVKNDDVLVKLSSVAARLISGDPDTDEKLDDAELWYNKLAKNNSDDGSDSTEITQPINKEEEIKSDDEPLDIPDNIDDFLHNLKRSEFGKKSK